MIYGEVVGSGTEWNGSTANHLCISRGINKPINKEPKQQQIDPEICAAARSQKHLPAILRSSIIYDIYVYMYI